MRRTALKNLFYIATLLAALSPCGAAERPYTLLARQAPDFALHSTAGYNMRLSEYRGDVVVLTFWGSRCGVCIGQLAALDKLQGTYRSAGLVTLAVDVDDNQAAAQEFSTGLPKGLAILMDPSKGVARRYKVDSLPMLLLIDRAGAVRHVHRDYHTGDEAGYLEQIKTLLDE